MQVQPHAFSAAPAAFKFALAGNATFTLRSKKTGKHFTYRVRRSEDGKVYFVALMVGPDNENSFKYLGFIKDVGNGPRYRHGGGKSCSQPDLAQARAFEWTWDALLHSVMPSSLEVWHACKCGRCGRKLTHPSSVESGFGPECAAMV